MRFRIAAATSIVFCIAWLVFFFYAISRDPAWAGAAYGALGALATLVALIAALAAFWISLGQYRAWRADEARTPDIHVWLAHFPDPTARAVPIDPTDPPQLGGTTWNLQLVISNKGDGTLSSGMVNLVVPAECEIVPVPTTDPPGPSPLRLVHGVFGSTEIWGNGHDSDVRFLVAERDYTPGDFIYKAEVRTPHAGRWPILIDLTGDPPPGRKGKLHLWIETGTGTT